MNNIRYSLIDDSAINKKISLDELKTNVCQAEEKYNEQKQGDLEMEIYNNIIFEEQDYMDNYTRKELDRIADYYNISKGKKEITISRRDSGI